MGRLGRRGALKAARAALPAPPRPGDATRAGGFAAPRWGKAGRGLRQAGLPGPGPACPTALGAKFPPGDARASAAARTQGPLEQSAPCPQGRRWDGMSGPGALRSLPHFPGFGFIPEPEGLHWKTKQLIFNGMKRQLLTSTGPRHKAHRQNRIITSTLILMLNSAPCPCMVLDSAT